MTKQKLRPRLDLVGCTVRADGYELTLIHAYEYRSLDPAVSEGTPKVMLDLSGHDPRGTYHVIQVPKDAVTVCSSGLPRTA